MQIDTSNTYTSAAYSNKGMSGLASGLDTESMVEKMLANAQAKIDKQNGLKQQAKWKQEIYRDVMSKLETFQNRYFKSSSGLFAYDSKLFNTMKTSATGSALRVLAGADAATGNTTAHVAQLAANARLESATARGAQPMEGTVNLNAFNERTIVFQAKNASGDPVDVSVDLAGATAETLAGRITDAFTGAGVSVTGVSFNGETGALKIAPESSITVSSDSDAMAVQMLGLQTGKSYNSIDTTVDLDPKAQLSITLNGETKTVEFSQAEIAGATGSTDAERMANLLKSKFSSFGDGLVVRAGSDGKLMIGTSDAGQRVSVSGGAVEMLGLRQGQSNKYNFTFSLKDTFGGQLTGGTEVTEGDGAPYTEYTFKINGAEIKVKDTDSVGDFVNKINAQSGEHGVKASYEMLTGNISLQAVNSGSGQKIEVEDVTGNALANILGAKDNSGNPSLAAAKLTEGQNAVVNINGVWTERNSNTFTQNSMTYTLTDKTQDVADLREAGWVKQEDGTYSHTYVNDAGTEVTETGKSLTDAMDAVYGNIRDHKSDAVTITTERDTGKLVDTMKDFVEDYNSLIKELNGYVDAKNTYKDYAPLTDAQKKEMSEKEIELWEKKAKEGLLRGDNDLSRLLSSMRSIVYAKPEGSKYALYDIGLETSDNWKDKGKLQELDESAFLAAMEKDPDAVAKLFQNSADGIAKKMDTLISDIATKNGSALRNRAGKEGYGDENTNELSHTINQIEMRLKTLKNSYEKERQRYWNQFNSMEQVIQQMNSQSAYLTQMLG